MPFEELDFIYMPSRDVDELEGRGWKRGHRLEIPHGPVRSFTTPGGHRLAIYQLVRPDVGEHFAGRRDFQ